jgi:uncharacterized protein (UPF0332 family)
MTAGALAQSTLHWYSPAVSLEKAQEFQKAAQRCIEERWYNSSVSRAYYAMFQAVRTALTHAGIARPWWSHASLHATFSTELVRRRKLYSRHFVHSLAEALELRHTADYSDIQVPPRRAAKAVKAAADLLSRVREVTNSA